MCVWFGSTIVSALFQVSAAAAQTPLCEFRDVKGIGGAYRMADGAIASLVPAGDDGHWRIRHFDSGKSHRLHPAGDMKFRSADDLDSELPVAFHYAFKLGSDDLVRSLSVESGGKRSIAASKIALRERRATFKSGDTELFGRLTLPTSGKGPFKAVIFVHGSDPEPSVGREWLPHLLAANGIATLVFDKRGTGCSKGQYVQHFDVLSDDVVAASQWLKSQPEIDQKRLGLAGFSQGGWVAPLAALKDRSIKFVAVGYGLAMSMAEEDRLEAPLKLKSAGIDDASVAEFQRLNAALHQVARDEFKDWRRFEQLVEQFKEKPWFALAAKQQSWFGVLMQMGLPQAKNAAPPMFQHFFQPFYEPVPTLQKLDIPMLWLIAAKDIEAPPEPTIDALNKLRRQGKPLTMVVFPNADHGMQDFELREGKRVRTKYSDGYFSTLLTWIQKTK